MYEMVGISYEIPKNASTTFSNTSKSYYIPSFFYFEDGKKTIATCLVEK